MASVTLSDELTAALRAVMEVGLYRIATASAVVEMFTIFFFEFPVFIVLLEDRLTRSDQEVDRESEERGKKENNKDRECLHEDVGSTIGDIFNHPNNKSTPDDEEISEQELDDEIEAHICGCDRGDIREECASHLHERDENIHRRMGLIHNLNIGRNVLFANLIFAHALDHELEENHERDEEYARFYVQYAERVKYDPGNSSGCQQKPLTQG